MQGIVDFLAGYKDVLHCLAEFCVHTLELIGILIIIGGAFKALCSIICRVKNKKAINVELGKTLSLALEFKMGAEIINTVIVRDLTELGTLAIVILIRALLAIFIHWEIRFKKQDKLELKEDK